MARVLELGDPLGAPEAVDAVDGKAAAVGMTAHPACEYARERLPSAALSSLDLGQALMLTI